MLQMTWTMHQSREKDSLDNVTEERDDRMTGTDEEEEYIDPHAADCTDLPEGADFDETRVSANEEDEQPV